MRVGLVQLCSKGPQYWRQNLDSACSLVNKCIESGARYIFLPEASDYIPERGHSAASDALNFGEWVKRLGEIAKTGNATIFVGLHEPIDNGESGQTFNSLVSISGQSGAIMAKYRKLHLFDIDHNAEKLTESDYVRAGDKAVTLELPVESEQQVVDVKLGLQICYDLRFPELALLNRLKGAHILLYPSAFSMATGPFHWECLLRARAIETQCFVIAAAQSGSHNPGRSSYGHSLIFDPWGDKSLRGLANHLRS